MITFVGSLHPVIVHFPLALVVTAALAEAAFSRSKNPAYGTASRFMLTVAALFAIPAAAFGFAAASEKTFEPAIASALSIHRILGVAAAVLTILTAGLAQAAGRGGEPWRVAIYRALLLVTLTAMGATGHFGAIVAHGPGYLSWR